MIIENPVLPAYKALYLRAYKAPVIYVPIRHYICRESSTNHLLFMQNKPNFQKSQMNVSIYLQTAYENKRNWTLGENKPNSNPIKANFKKAKMSVNSLITKDYRKKDDFSVRINKPNSNPISLKAKMNVNLFAATDYENEPPCPTRKNKPKQSQFQNPAPRQRQAFFAHQRSRVDLPLGKSKQTVTSRPSAYQVWLCNCSSFFTRRNRTGLLLAISLGRVVKVRGFCSSG